MQKVLRFFPPFMTEIWNKGDPRSEIRGQLIKGFWQFSADLAETGWVGAFWPHMKIAKPKFPIYIIFDPILALKRVQMGSNLNFRLIWLKLGGF